MIRRGCADGEMVVFLAGVTIVLALIVISVFAYNVVERVSKPEPPKQAEQAPVKP